MKTSVRLIIFILIISIVLPVFAVGAANSDSMSVSAKSAVLIEEDSGNIIWAKNENKRLGMASTTKIMTAIVAIENSDISKIVTVSPCAVGVEGSSVYLWAGEQISMENLLYALMMESANDAAAAISYEIAGGVEAFAMMMNDKAADLGLTDTHFTNPHGLYDENHFTTAYELALITRYAMQNETFAKIVSTKRKVIPLHDSGASRVLINHNRLLKSYNDIIGVKTGFTKKTGRTLVSAARADGVMLIAVTLDDPDDWRDHRAMLDFGFSLYERATLAKAGGLSYNVHVCGGYSDTVKITNTEDVTASLSRERTKISAKTEIPRFLYASINSGDTVGYVKYYLDGKLIATAELKAAEDIPAKRVKRGLFK